MGKLFGTDGVRGEANKFLTAKLVLEIGKAGAYYLCKGQQRAKILIGKDTRVSGDMLESALIAGITSLGIHVVKVGVLPTPALSYLTKGKDVQAGIMISASHNPAKDNGIKFFNGDGFKLSDEQEKEIEDIIFNSLDDLPIVGGDKVGRVEFIHNAIEGYSDYIKGTVGSSFEGLKVVVDTANGAAYRLAPKVLEELGAQVIAINNSPNGFNINLDCGSTHPEALREEVLKSGAHIGIANDGDADRLIAVDEKGNLIDGDYILAICGRQLIREGRLEKNIVVATQYSNLGLGESMEELGGKVSVTANGDRYVLARMLEEGYNLGGEKSGHIIFLDYNSTGDGVLSALQLIDVMQKRGLSLSELAKELKEYPQVLKNVVVESKNWEENKEIEEAIAQVERLLGDEGRIFVRASGTEPVIRVMVEAKDKVQVEELADKVAHLIEKELG